MILPGRLCQPELPNSSLLGLMVAASNVGGCAKADVTRTTHVDKKAWHISLLDDAARDWLVD